MIDLTASPHNVLVPMTESLWMKCSLNDSSSAAPGVGSVNVVGRALPAISANKNRDSKRSASTGVHHVPRSAPAEEIRHISAITITRNGAPVATVSPYTAAKAESDLDLENMKVSGDVSKTSGELGFLELQWHFPTAEQTGEYECSVSGVSDAGHSVTLTSSVDIERSMVGLDDVINEVSGLKSEMSSLKAEVKQLRHVEYGSLNCGWNSATWPLGDPSTRADGGSEQLNYYWHETKVNASFQSAYTSPPVVFLSTSHLYITKDQHTHYGTQLLSVDQQGFSFRCGSGGTGWLVQDLEVRWMSIPV